MKQIISVEQLQELIETQKERLRKWWQPKIGDIGYYHYRLDMFISQEVLKAEDITDLQEKKDIFLVCENGEYKAQGQHQSDERNIFLEGVMVGFYGETEHGRLYINKMFCLPRLSIGQMISLLANKLFNIGKTSDCYYVGISLGSETLFSPISIRANSGELCDALWEAVKAVL